MRPDSRISAPAPSLPTRAILYRPEAAPSDAYLQERCRLDIHLPTSGSAWPTVVWFHGGGLTGGSRSGPEQLVAQGIAVVAAGYRLSPRVTCPTYLTDAAAAVAWVLEHIADYRGDPQRVFVGGVSAGGYLAAMVGMDPTWLGAHGRAPSELAGLVLISAQVTTHFTVRGEHGQSETVPVIDQYAPAAFVDQPLAPMLIVCGDSTLDMPARVEENRWFAALLRDAGHQRVSCHTLEGFGHGNVGEGAMPLVRAFLAAQTGPASSTAGRTAVAVAAPRVPVPLALESWGRASSTGLAGTVAYDWNPAGLQVEITVTDPATALPQPRVQIGFQAQARSGTARTTGLTLALVDGRCELFCTGAQQEPCADAPRDLPRTFQPIIGADVAITRTGDTLRYRLRIPPTWLGQEALAAGDSLALSVLVDDRDPAAGHGGLRWGDGLIGGRQAAHYNRVVLDR
jgi:acetyl esterase/lipase